MKILHTADLHLRKGHDAGIEVLSWLVGKAGELEVDACIIAGDLFDSDTDATLMRQKLRNLFDSATCKFIVLPGNHDENSYGPDFDYGRNVIQFTEKPFRLVEIGDIRICGVPYQHNKFSEFAKGFPAEIDILVAHGTIYDPSYIFSLLDDPETEYMPIFPPDLQDTARYVAMGHLHANHVDLTYGKTRVVYPGSPIALDKKCDSERSYALVEIDRARVEVNRCGIERAQYWLTREFFVYPDAEERILTDIEEFLEGIDNLRIMPNVVVRGYIGDKETKYLECLESVREKFEKKFARLDFVPNIQSWERVISNPMVKRFIAKTNDLEDSIRLKVFEICLPIFDRVLK
ncbi:MAG: metallophosphoesterase [candidate division WOR-3 bacterium]|nr:MAG: metallophosphoesterase [candidate division WOR-3 bacterium]